MADTFWASIQTIRWSADCAGPSFRQFSMKVYATLALWIHVCAVLTLTRALLCTLYLMLTTWIWPLNFWPQNWPESYTRHSSRCGKMLGFLEIFVIELVRGMSGMIQWADGQADIRNEIRNRASFERRFRKMNIFTHQDKSGSNKTKRKNTEKRNKLSK